MCTITHRLFHDVLGLAHAIDLVRIFEKAVEFNPVIKISKVFLLFSRFQ